MFWAAKLAGTTCLVSQKTPLYTFYHAWLAGYVKIAGAQLDGAPDLSDDADVAKARAWVKAYCVRRASDTYLTAAVRFLEDRERSGFIEREPDDIRVAGKS